MLDRSPNAPLERQVLPEKPLCSQHLLVLPPLSSCLSLLSMWLTKKCQPWRGEGTLVTVLLYCHPHPNSLTCLLS